MKLFNTLSRKKELFVPLKEGHVSMYVCGPTIYDLAHVGHARSAVAFDVVRRYLEYKGFEVNFVFNYTDIDDKMIKRAAEMGISVPELAEKIGPEYDQDYGALNIIPPSVNPQATDFVEEMIEVIRKLDDEKVIYVIDDGVYFDVTRCADYGKLSGQNLDDLKSGVRKEANSRKRNPQDFVLWKFAKEGEPSWPSPWGEGRPGWHIECSAMSMSLLGETIDIHGGGGDLTFPHHECEIAQSETATGNQFARYWMHNGFITIDNEKMSKSLDNFFTIREVLKEFDPMVVRLFLIHKHYRSPINFSRELLEQSKKSLARIHEFLLKLSSYTSESEDNADVDTILAEARKKFEEGMDDDFETPKALAAVFDCIRQVNGLMAEEKLSSDDAIRILSQMQKFDEVLGVLHVEEKDGEISPEVLALIEAREKARSDKDWARADEIRDELLNSHSIIVEDTAKGTLWKHA